MEGEHTWPGPAAARQKCRTHQDKGGEFVRSARPGLHRWAVQVVGRVPPRGGFSEPTDNLGMHGVLIDPFLCTGEVLPKPEMLKHPSLGEGLALAWRPHEGLGQT
jgi:hypothetical protein